MGTKDYFIPAVDGSVIRGVGDLEKGEVGTSSEGINYQESWGAGERSRGGHQYNFIPAVEGSIIRKVRELEEGAEVGTKDNFIPALGGSNIGRVAEL